MQKRDASEHTKTTARLWRTTAIGKASGKKSKQAEIKRRRANPALRLMHNIQGASLHLVSGKHPKSPTFVARTAFFNERHFLSHLEDSVATKGWMWDDHGEVWQIDHKIPQEAFNFNDPEDVKRCWSPANVHAMTKEDNNAKLYKIIDEFCLQVGSDHFPKSWNGAIPNQKQKEIIYARVHTGRGQATGAGSSSMAYTSEAEDSAAESLDMDSAEESSEAEDSDSEVEATVQGSAAASLAAAEMDQEAEDSAMEGSVEEDWD
jgi:hypothetical protein